ncbi:unnamed protein product [Discula destructiva]
MGTRPKDDGLDVSDSTDWLGTPLSSLMQVEQSLRCHVCKEFFNSPMITSCSHTFCSLCIRRALNVDGKCPFCRNKDQESKLRGNWAIREACEAFMASRTAMLDLARRPPALAATPPKRKADERLASGESASKRTRMSTRSSSARAAGYKVALIREESGEPEGAEDEDEYIPDDGLAECPICTWRMKIERVSTHMDTDCPGKPCPQPKPSQPTKFGFAPSRSAGAPQAATHDRLPSTNYSLLNDTKLRKKLADIGIPNWGTRANMEQRHKEWVMIWNANCDSSRPKTKQKLLQDLDIWERTQGAHASMSSASTQLGAQIKDKDFDGAGWSTKHSDSFDDLIAQARRSRKAAEKPPQPSSPSADGAGVDPPRANGVGRADKSSAMDMDEPPPVQTPIDNSKTIDLTSPVRLPKDESGSRMPDEELTNVDTVVSSAFVGTQM